MANYKISLDRFIIENTRARHNDTVFVGIGALVGNQTLGPVVKSMGDLNNGTFNVGLDVGPVQINPNTPVRISYVLINIGNKPKVDAENTVKSAISHNLTSAVVLRRAIGGKPSGSGNGSDDWWKKVIEEIIKAIPQIVGILMANCDGPVAADVIETTGAAIDANLGGAVKFEEERFYPGIDSPTVRWTPIVGQSGALFKV